MGAPKFQYYTKDESGRVPCLVSHWAEGCPMPDAYLNGRPIYFGDISHGVHGACNSFFESASYADTDEDLNDDELTELSDDNGLYLGEQWFEWCVGRAETAYEGDR